MWGVVFEEEVEVALALVHQAAEGRDVHFPERGVHQVLQGQVEDLLKGTDLRQPLLHGGLVESKVPQQDDQLVEELLRGSSGVKILHLLLAVLDAAADVVEEEREGGLLGEIGNHSPHREEGQLVATVEDLGGHHQNDFSCGWVALRQISPRRRRLSDCHLVEVPTEEWHQTLNES